MEQRGHAPQIVAETDREQGSVVQGRQGRGRRSRGDHGKREFFAAAMAYRILGHPVSDTQALQDAAPGSGDLRQTAR